MLQSSRAPRQRHTQVRPWTVSASTCQLALARCVRSCQVQALPDSPPVSEQQGAALPCWQLHPRFQHRQSAATTLSSTSPSGCTTTQPQHTWPSVIFCRRSYRLEFDSRRAPRSRLYRRQISNSRWRHTFSRSISMQSALDILWRRAVQIYVSSSSPSSVYGGDAPHVKLLSQLVIFGRPHRQSHR